MAGIAYVCGVHLLCTVEPDLKYACSILLHKLPNCTLQSHTLEHGYTYSDSSVQELVWLRSVCVVIRFRDLEDMLRCQMACQSMSEAEGLSFTEQEFQDEYQVACKQFEDGQHEYDDARLQEQVKESLKVGLAWMTAALTVCCDC